MNGSISEGEQLHTFAVCAYKESPFLEECVRSLVRQTVKSRILIGVSVAVLLAGLMVAIGYKRR